VLIRRSALLFRDPGHVAFPGGRIEPGESPLDAALREASEEVGLEPAAVAAIGALKSGKLEVTPLQSYLEGSF